MASPAAVLNILVNAQTGKASADLKRFNGELRASEAQASRSTGAAGKFAKAAKMVGVAAGAGAAYGLFKGVTAGAAFEKQMDALGSVAQATSKEMGRLEKQALALGESTAFTANEVAKAQTELAKGGLTVKQIYGGGVKAALSLAAAGELDLAAAADTTVNAMKLFGLRGKDAMKVADALATAANKTTADVGDFALALKQGGSVARLAGFDLNETVTALEALAEAGIRGSDAGTSLKSFFVNIGTPSEKAKRMMDELGMSIFKQNGELKKLPAIAANLRQAFGDLTQEEFLEKAGTIAGSDAIRSLYSLYDAGPQKLRALEQANAKHGTALKVAAEKTDNLTGDTEELGGALETKAVLGFKKLQPFLRSAVQGLTEFVRSIGTWNAQEIAQKLGIGRKEFKQFGQAAQNVAAVFNKFVRPVIRTAVEAIISLLKNLAVVIRGVVRVIGGILTGDFAMIWRGVKDIFRGGVNGTVEIVRGITKPIRTIAAAAGEGIGNVFSAAWEKIKSIFEDGRDAVLGVVEEIVDVLNKIPGVPDIEIGSPASPGRTKKTPAEKRRGYDRRYSGGAITKPMAIVGEEAPRYHEWVIATNPAYRENNVKYWAQAGADLGVPGFAVGGLLGDTVGKAAGAAGDVIGSVAGKGANFFIGQLPKPNLPEPFAALGPYLISQVTEFIKSGFKDKKFGSLIGGVGGAILSGSGPVEKVFANVAKKLSRSKIATLALGMAGYAESGMRDLGYGHSTSQGSLQLLASTASSLGIDPHDEAAVSSYFLTRGFWGKGSANSLAAQGLPAHLVAQNVQGSAFSDGSNYLAQEGPAKRWMKRFGLRKGGLVGGLLRMAGGGMVDVPGDSASGVVNPSIVDLVSAYARKFDTNVNYGYDPGGGHVSPGHNVTGTATDVGPNQGSWTGLFEDGLRLLTSKGFEVLYGTDGIGISYPNHGRGNHAHIEWVGNGTAADARSRLREALGGAGSAGSGSGLTEGQQTAAEGKARKKAREAQLKKLRQAVTDAKTDPAKQSKLWRLVKFWGRNGMFDKDERSKILGMVTQAASKTKVGDTVNVLQNLAAYAGEHGEITGKDPDNWHSLIDGMNKAQDRGREVRDKAVDRQRKRKEAIRNKKIAKIAERAEMPELVKHIESLRAATDRQDEFAGQLVTLEPENLSDDYVGQERSAYEGSLGNLATWRNAVVKGRDLASQRILRFQTEMANINAFKGLGIPYFTAIYNKQKWRLPELEKAIATTTSLRDETLMGELEELSPLATSGIIPSLPQLPVAGQFGGRIFDTQNTIRELGLRPGGSVAGEDTSERLAWLEEQLRQANQRNLVFERQKPIIDRYMSMGNFAGMFAKGGSIPAGMWGIAGERGLEPVFGPATVVSSEQAQGVFGSQPINIEVHNYADRTEVLVNGMEEVAAKVFDHKSRQQGRAAKTIGARKAGRGM